MLITEATQVSYETEVISGEIIYPQNLPTYLDFGTSGGLENSPLFGNDRFPSIPTIQHIPISAGQVPATAERNPAPTHASPEGHSPSELTHAGMGGMYECYPASDDASPSKTG